MLLPERIATYGNKEWRMAVLTAVKSAVRTLYQILIVCQYNGFLLIVFWSLTYILQIWPDD